jgi:hypothetical protein
MLMRSIYRLRMAPALALAVSMLLMPLSLLQSARAAPSDSGASSGSVDIDADALTALKSMSGYLRTLKAFQVKAVVTRDDVLDDGQLIQFDTHVDLLARMPDRLRVEVTSSRQHRLYFYDGKNFTLYAERVNYYATVPAPPTIGKLSDALHDKYDLDLPLEDLFLWAGPESKIGDITGAMDVGPAEVGGITCEQYAFRQPGLNWQIWIQQGDFPLPKKLVISTLTDEARPQYSSVLEWNLAPSFNEAAFQFDAPSGAQKIVFATANASDAAAKK